jgi:hypothetical protein
MWERLWETVKTVFTLAENLEENREEIKEIRQELRDLTVIVQRLAAHIEANEKRELTERENLVLRLQNELLRLEQRMERRLPPPQQED